MVRKAVDVCARYAVQNRFAKRLNRNKGEDHGGFALRFAGPVKICGTLPAHSQQRGSQWFTPWSDEANSLVDTVPPLALLLVLALAGLVADAGTKRTHA